MSTLQEYERRLTLESIAAERANIENRLLTADGYNNGFLLQGEYSALQDPAVLSQYNMQQEEYMNAERRRALAEYTVADMDPAAARNSRRMFGNVNPNNTTADAYTNIGRAYCATYGMQDTPADLIRAGMQQPLSTLPGADTHAAYRAEHASNPNADVTFNLQFPAEWQTKEDLYRSIGEQFSAACRKKATQRIGQEKAAMQKRAEEQGRQATEALNAVVLNGQKEISVEQAESLAACGFSYESAKKARQAYETWLAITDKELDTMTRSRDKTPQQVSKMREELKQARLSGTPQDRWAIAAAADIIGGDEQARALYIDAVRNHALKNANQVKDKGNLANAAAGIGRAFNTVVENLGDAVMLPVETAMNAVDSARGEDVHWYDALPFVNESMRERRRSALTDEVRKTVEEARSAVNKDRPMWTDAPVNAVEGLAQFSMLLNKKTAAVGAYNLYKRAQQEAYGKIANAPNGTRDTNLQQADWYETVATPATRAGITYAAFALVGGINGAIGKSAGAMWENTAAQGTKLLVSKVLSNRAVAFGASAVKADIALQEIQGIEYLANSALDLIVPERQQKGAELREGIARNWSREGAEERIWSALLFGAAGFNGMRDVQLLRKWENTLGMSKEQKDRLHATRNEAEFKRVRETIFRELNEADPTAFANNLEKAGEIILSEAEKEEMLKSGITEHILQSRGITSRPLPEGKKEYTLPQADGKTKTVVWSAEQMNNYIWNTVNAKTLEYARDIQARARGEKLAAAAERKADDYLTILSMANFEPEILSTLKDGMATEKTFRALADLGNRSIDAWQKHYETAGYNTVEARAAAAAERHAGTGATYGTLAEIANNFAARQAYARQTGELSNGAAAGSAAFLLPRSAGELTLALARGQVTEAEALHDLIEARIRHTLDTAPETAAALKETLVRIDRDLRNRLGSKNGILPQDRKASELTATELTEAMSHLATADFLANRDSLPLSAETHAALNTAAEHLADLQTITTIADLWKRYAQTDRGKATLAENADLLQNILKDSNAYIGDLYAEAEKTTTAEAVAAIIDRERGNAAATRERVEQYRASRENPTAEERAAQPESETNPYPISAEDSPTGEAIPAEKLLPQQPIDPATGQYQADPATLHRDPQGIGRNFVNGEYTTDSDGYPIGSCAIDTVTLPAACNTERGQYNIRRYDNPETPVIIFRNSAGELTAISGIGSLINSKTAGRRFTEAKIIDESPRFTAADAFAMRTEYEIRMQLASARQTYSYLAAHNITRAEAAERGLITSTPAGGKAPAVSIALQLRENAAPELTRAYTDGSVSEETALRICELAPADADLQQQILKWKADKRNLKWSTITNKAQEYRAARAEKQNNAGNTTTFSVRELKQRKPLAELLHEERMRVLLSKSKDLARRAKTELRGKDPRVAELIGQVVGLHSLMRKEFENSPAAKESTKTALTHAEMRIRALGDILNGKTDTANVKRLPAAVQESAKQAIRSGNRTRWACDYLLETEQGLIEHAARTIEREEADYALDKLDSLIALAHPRLNRQTNRGEKGRVGAAAARNVVRYRQLMNLPAYEVNKRIQEQQERIETAKRNNDSEAETAALEEYAALTTYGGVREKNIDALRTAADRLTEYIETEKKAWVEKLQEQYNLAAANREAIRAAVPKIDSARIQKEEKEDGDNKFKNALRTIANFASLHQLMERATKIEGVGPVMRRWRQKVSVARDKCANILKSDYTNEQEWLAKTLGLRTSTARAAWLENTTTINKTTISTEGRRDMKLGTLSLDEAERIIRLTPEQRAEERAAAEQKQRNAAARAGQTADEAEYAPTTRAAYPSEAAVADLKIRIERRMHMDDRIDYANYGEMRDLDHRSENMELSKQQAANIILMAEQPAYAAELDALGYTPAVLQQLRDYAGADVLAYAYHCRDYLADILKDTVTVYEDRYGIPFPAEENYWPGNFETSAQSDAAHGLDYAAGSQVGIHTFLIARKLTNADINTTFGVTQVFRIALQAHRNFQTCSRIGEEIRRTISDPDTQNRLKQIMGYWDFARFTTAVDTIDNAYRADIAACRAERKFMSAMNNAKVFTWLAGRLTSICYTLTNINAARAAEGITLRDLVAACLTARTAKGKLPMTPARMYHSEAIQARLMKDDAYERLTMQPQNTKFSITGVVGDIAMQQLSKADAAILSLSMSALYNADYRRMSRLHPELPETAVREYCNTRVSETLHLAAQPVDATDKSVRYISNTDALAQYLWFAKTDVLTALSTSLSIARREEARTAAQQKAAGTLNGATARKIARMYSYLLPGSLITQAVRTAFTEFTGNRPDPDENPEGYLNWHLTNCVYALMLGGWLENLPFIGDAIRQLSDGKNLIATSTSAGGRSNIQTLGLGDIKTMCDVLGLTELTARQFRSAEEQARLDKARAKRERAQARRAAKGRPTESPDYKKYLNAFRGASLIANTLLPRTSKTAAFVVGGINAVNVGANLSRDVIIRAQNANRKEIRSGTPRRKKKRKK